MDDDVIPVEEGPDVGDEALGRSIDAMSQHLLGATSLSETLLYVARLAVAAIAPADFVGITLPVRGRLTTGVFTNPEAPEIDQAQYDTGRGPCVRAFHDGVVVRIESTGEDRQFPEFSRTAYEHGIRSTLSMPMAAADKPVGALNMYSRELDSFGTSEVAAATRFATQAAVVLFNAQSYNAAVELSEQLRAAIDSRETIDLSRGIIIANTRCTPDEAFRLLVEQSQHTNTKIRDIAARLVATATRRHPEDSS